MRRIIIQFSCNRGIEDCINTSKSYFKDWMNTPSVNNIPKNYRSLVYCTAIKYGSNLEWEFALEQYIHESDSNSRKELQSGMSCTREPWIMNKFLNYQLNDSITRKQDSLFGLSYAASHSYSNLLTWNFVKNNWNELLAR